MAFYFSGGYMSQISTDALFQSLREMSAKDDPDIKVNIPDILGELEDVGNLEKITRLVDAIGREDPLKDISKKIAAARNTNYLSNDVLEAFSNIDLQDLFANSSAKFSNSYIRDVLTTFKSCHVVAASGYF